MPVINVNLIRVADQGFDSLPVEIKPGDDVAEKIPASSSSVTTNISSQGYGHGIARTYSGGVR